MIDRDSLLRSRLEEFLENSYCKYDYIKFTDFLDEFECSVCISFFKSMHFDNFKLDGGYENASRKMLAVYSDESLCRTFPFKVLKITFSNELYLNHRNILGALMNLNLARFVIGDICLIEGHAYVFCTTEAATVIKNELKSVGKSSVTIEDAEHFKDYEPQKLLEQHIISSERLDCIVAALGNFSRNKAEDLISSSLVFVNGIAEKNSAKKIKENSKISVRGLGKFEILSLSERTHKDRIKLKINKFI